MSAFSFTAPYLTAEEEEAERLALTESEKKQLQSDLYGDRDEQDIGDTFFLDYDKLTLAINLLKEGMTSLPPSETQAYYEACERSPHLVESESNPIRFLNYDNYDAWAAASRLAKYWKCRKELFGSDLAFLPMSLNGAMSDDIDALRKGIILILPNDVSGRFVLFLDRIRMIVPVLNRGECTRIFFYVLHIILSRCPVEAGCSVIIMANVRGYDLYKHFDRILTKKLLKVADAMPLRRVSVHLFSGSGKSVLNLVMPVLKNIVGKRVRLRMIIHSGSDNEIVERLALYGIVGSHLQPIVSTSYKADNSQFLGWLDEQILLENSQKGEDVCDSEA